MSVTFQSFSLLNPNPSCGLKKPAQLALCSSPSSSLRFDQLTGARGFGALTKGLAVLLFHCTDGACGLDQLSFCCFTRGIDKFNLSIQRLGWRMKSEDSKEYISTAAKNSPEPEKEIVETINSSADDLNDVSKVLDFHVGIPYGPIISQLVPTKIR
ncbi:protein FATTY ACID EXPORT 3 chloroplastic isoform X1 [Prunus yedoensis var. nudiflora]|uniref:Protein FATTY ACID EXPORT 3 chloroplastic isoform X1 n=1 Tax=Prunus yedoensis var. nudiflora TaxID=2094558 RepID=A0A314Z3M6_PRUYE|nr:protein FATTY ACID EXPORT 3 chloroplastic isoform X1 [Prunus yedoensis var. nudiflora]